MSSTACDGNANVCAAEGCFGRACATVARLDSYPQEAHGEGVRAARSRAETKRASRRERAMAAAARLRRGGS